MTFFFYFEIKRSTLLLDKHKLTQVVVRNKIFFFNDSGSVPDNIAISLQRRDF